MKIKVLSVLPMEAKLWKTVHLLWLPLRLRKDMNLSTGRWVEQRNLLPTPTLSQLPKM